MNLVVTNKSKLSKIYLQSIIVVSLACSCKAKVDTQKRIDNNKKKKKRNKKKKKNVERLKETERQLNQKRR